MAEIGKIIGKCKDGRAELGSKMRERERGALGKKNKRTGADKENQLLIFSTRKMLEQ